MRIIVVRTCDGDVYFRGLAKHEAAELAAQQVCVNDIGRWDQDAVCAMRTQVELRDPEGLFRVGLAIGVIRWAEVRNY